MRLCARTPSVPRSQNSTITQSSEHASARAPLALGMPVLDTESQDFEGCCSASAWRPSFTERGSRERLLYLRARAPQVSQGCRSADANTGPHKRVCATCARAHARRGRQQAPDERMRCRRRTARPLPRALAHVAGNGPPGARAGAPGEGQRAQHARVAAAGGQRGLQRLGAVKAHVGHVTNDLARATRLSRRALVAPPAHAETPHTPRPSRLRSPSPRPSHGAAGSSGRRSRGPAASAHPPQARTGAGPQGWPSGGVP